MATENQSTILRLLAERREDLGHERARLLNRLHRLLRELIPGGVESGLSAEKAAAAMRTIRPATATDALRRELAKELLADLRRIDAGIKNNEAQTRDAKAATGTTLQEISGVGVGLVQNSSATSATSPDSPAPHTTPATPEQHPSTPTAVNKTATDSTPEATGSSIPCCTPWPSAKAETPARQGVLPEEIRRGKNTPRSPQGTQTTPLQCPLQADTARPPSSAKTSCLTHRGAIRSDPADRSPQPWNPVPVQDSGQRPGGDTGECSDPRPPEPHRPPGFQEGSFTFQTQSAR